MDVGQRRDLLSGGDSGRRLSGQLRSPHILSPLCKYPARGTVNQQSSISRTRLLSCRFLSAQRFSLGFHIATSISVRPSSPHRSESHFLTTRAVTYRGLARDGPPTTLAGPAFISSDVASSHHPRHFRDGEARDQSERERSRDWCRPHMPQHHPSGSPPTPVPRSVPSGLALPPALSLPCALALVLGALGATVALSCRSRQTPLC